MSLLTRLRSSLKEPVTAAVAIAVVFNGSLFAMEQAEILPFTAQATPVYGELDTPGHEAAPRQKKAKKKARIQRGPKPSATGKIFKKQKRSAASGTSSSAASSTATHDE